IASLKEPRGPQGVKYIPDLKLLAVTSGGDGKCRIYDERLELRHTIDHLDDADNVRYDEKKNLLYVGYGTGALAVIDPKTGERLRSRDQASDDHGRRGIHRRDRAAGCGSLPTRGPHRDGAGSAHQRVRSGLEDVIRGRAARREAGGGDPSLHHEMKSLPRLC